MWVDAVLGASLSGSSSTAGSSILVDDAFYLSA
eukprot:CAMPEP_0201231148 /NCGR_PEP_ID=MMETSP0852-20130820/2820_1 /ASSEMBLY_ACC=CAM_ASM_000632 /TAXON_ID=183588 /ORGANISM="Pseudo-nitzschia fraudulenta, Strain WWA7" /LENGTH=32 /DNA_ID= /DNA_START= /DNA_END= /DNA_ORIENTATION=